MAENKVRIDILDGFRCIAILMVVLYHFYTRWTPPVAPVNYYPYGDSAASWFRYGYLGVNFFFIISGFVIFYTLEKSKTAGSFFVKRLIRLFPPMLLCSVITFFAIKALDPGHQFALLHSETALNFFPSLTFSHPIFWVKLFHNDHVEYIDGAYWSLWVEVTFYLLAGLLFFTNKQKFLQRWCAVMVVAILLKIVTLPQFAAFIAGRASLAGVMNIVTRALIYVGLLNFMVYFTLGMYFYCLFFKKQVPRLFQVLCGLLTVVELLSMKENAPRLVFVLMIIIFLLFVYRQQYLAFMKYRLIARIGVISYTLYLIHQNIGVLLINKLSGSIQSPVLLKLIPIGVIAILVVFAELIYRAYEKPVMARLHKLTAG